MRKIYFIVAILMILAFLLGLFLNKIVFTGKVVETEENLEKHTLTKAICNSENECIDVLITCENGKVVKIEPVSELVKHSEDWNDLRNPSDLCHG